jgi:hypothetical protein
MARKGPTKRQRAEGRAADRAKSFRAKQTARRQSQEDLDAEFAMHEASRRNAVSREDEQRREDARRERLEREEKERLERDRLNAILTRPTPTNPRDATRETTPDGDDPADDVQAHVARSDQGWRALIAGRIAEEDYSFNALGAETGISPAVIMRFAKGERDIRLATAEKLCAALDLVLVPREALEPPTP